MSVCFRRNVSRAAIKDYHSHAKQKLKKNLTRTIKSTVFPQLVAAARYIAGTKWMKFSTKTDNKSVCLHVLYYTPMHRYNPGLPQ